MGFDKEKIAELYPGAENMMFPPMKYYAASDEKIDRACETNDWFGEKKIDGALYLATLTEKGDYLFSRTPSKKTGLLVDKSENVPHIMNALSVLPKGTILLGEIYYPNGTSKNVTSIMGCLPEKAKERQMGEYGYISYYVHDILWYNGINLITGKATNLERYCILQKVWEKYNLEHPNIHLAEAFFDDFKGRAARIISEGGEGIVMKLKTGVYECDKRPQTNFKVKSVDYVDVICLEGIDPTREYNGKDIESWEYWEERLEADKDGNYRWEKTKGYHYEDYQHNPHIYHPITKAYYYGWKTAIRIGLYNSKGEIEEIGTVSSGLTDELRADLAENPSKYEGRVVAIQAMSRDKKEHTLRHPFIVQFRDDKPARDCTIEETFS